MSREAVEKDVIWIYQTLKNLEDMKYDPNYNIFISHKISIAQGCLKSVLRELKNKNNGIAVYNPNPVNIPQTESQQCINH